MYVVTHKQFVQKFWSRTRWEGECLVWTGPTIKSGGNTRRGAINRQRKHILVYRFAYMLICGPIPAGLQILHSCDNPLCINPKHLFSGTQADNMQDMVRKGRASWQTRPETRARGIRHGRARLNDGQVREIRALAAAGMSRYKIAALFHVSYPTVTKIINREIWFHLTE